MVVTFLADIIKKNGGFFGNLSANGAFTVQYAKRIFVKSVTAGLAKSAILNIRTEVILQRFVVFTAAGGTTDPTISVSATCILMPSSPVFP